MDAVLQEIQEHNNYARDTFTRFLTWFTFFTGVNLAGFGWFSSMFMDKGVAPELWIVASVATYFVIQNLLAIAACKTLLTFWSRIESRLSLLADSICSQDATLRMPVKSAFPGQFYARVTKLVQSTFPTMILLWLLIATIAFVRR